MFIKLLLTFGVIVIAILLARGSNRPGPRQGKPLPSSENETPASPARITAWILIGVIITITLTYSAFQWFGETEMVTVRVINSNTGESIDYRVYRDQAGMRRFQTVDGRTVTLAGVERMETLP